MQKIPLRQRSALVNVLIALIPYSEQNLKLSYKPAEFFNDLEKISNYKRRTLQDAYNRGVRTGYIDYSQVIPKLTRLGHNKVMPFVAKKLGPRARLMVIFDIPEADRPKRQIFRRLLKQCQFRQVQKSVWESQYDYKEILVAAINELGLDKCVEVYESARIHPQPNR